jgi:hypothetical protein
MPKKLMRKARHATAEKAIKIRIELVTPARALEYLKHRARNRKLIEFHLLELAQDMKEGNWVFNGIPICFNQAGELIEGQHRLEAVTRTGLAQKFVIIDGLPQAAFDTYDLHSKRSTKDYLSMEHVHYAPQLAAASRYLTQMKRHGSFQSKQPATHKEKIQTIDQYPDLVAFVAAYAREKLPLKISAAVVAVVHILLKEKNAEAADQYMHGVLIGEQLSVGDPRYAVRQWIIKRPLGETGWAARDFSQRAANVLIHGWNQWRAGEKLTVIKPVRETPEISK